MNPPLTWLDISRSALRTNVSSIRRLIGRPVAFMAVVKSNAYGHGLSEVVRALRGRVDWFGVANLDEAKLVRAVDRTTPTLVLSYAEPERWREAKSARADFPVYSVAQLRALVRLTDGAPNPLRVQLKLDVGTTRIGLLPEELPSAIKILKRAPWLHLTGTFSHLADSENVDQTFTNEQNQRFFAMTATLEQALGPIRLKHIACTAAALVNPPTRHDLVRVGIGLYGIWPDQALRPAVRKEHASFDLVPALTWQTRLIAVKRVRAGTTIGYGRIIRLRQPTTIGVIPVGYNEGYDRRLSNRGVTLVRGGRAPVIGRVCMNLTMLDLSHIRAPKPGDVVTLVGGEGPQGRGVTSADSLSASIDTIPYEFLARISPSLRRVLVP